MHPKIHTVSEASVLIAALATVSVVILEESGEAFAWLPLPDWAIWVVFATALALDTFYAESPARHLRSHPLDIAVVVLSFPMLSSLLALTRLARLIRIVRVLRVAGISVRSMRALKATIGRRELLYVCSICLTLVITAAVTLAMIEPDTVGDSFPNALWWSVVTVTTVGYGDIAPVTIPGRIAAIVIMLAGLGVISTLSASVAAYFVDEGNQSELQQIKERLERIESILERGAADRQTSTRR